MPKYEGDPRWMIARFTSVCKCGNTIKKGDEMFYYPRTRTALCKHPCGEAASAEFNAMAQDEDFMNHGQSDFGCSDDFGQDTY